MQQNEALRAAVTAGLDTLDRLEEEGVADLEFKSTDSGALVAATWPILEGFRNREGLHEFHERMEQRFPDYHLVPFGGGVFEYIMGNIRRAVLLEAICRLEKLEESM